MGAPPALIQRKAEIWPSVIEGLSEGKSAIELANQFGVSQRTLQHWIMMDEEADKVRAAYFAREMADAYEDLTNCTNGLDLAKAKERLNHIRHIAEVRAKRYFGKEAQVQINMLSGEQALTRIRQLEQELGYTIDLEPTNTA